MFTNVHSDDGNSRPSPHWRSRRGIAERIGDRSPTFPALNCGRAQAPIDPRPMQRLYHDEPIPDELRGAVIALGNFDGFHLGHQAVVKYGIIGLSKVCLKNKVIKQVCATIMTTVISSTTGY